ncbi:hypothetical protein QC762_600510 [Podospora pseudocomata]|uniref:SGNH hydrolase-type esterase domain-containing protein n=1 Tax=Podospora pseudocomata TaxID=2093779 RepID=A0ABR0G7U3_9PEZI|nr:hypothetical protein QC762_600510 [Podospora pseudocomata]
MRLSASHNSSYPLIVILSALILPVWSQSTVRILPLGDSITGGPESCWQALLWRRLQQASITNTKFVGSRSGQQCDFEYDGANEGHVMIQATGIVSEGKLVPWLESSKPDVVMMHLGTNDVLNNKPTAEILQAFGTMVDWMRENKKVMRIIVAQIIPLDSVFCEECGERVVRLNEAIPEWAKGLNTTESVIEVVDCWTGFDTDSMTSDGVHPNNAGNEKVAECWFKPLSRAIESVGGGEEVSAAASPGMGAGSKLGIAAVAVTVLCRWWW